MDTLRSRHTEQLPQDDQVSGLPEAPPPSARRRRFWTLLVTRPLVAGVVAVVVLIALPALAYTGANAYRGWHRHHHHRPYPGPIVGQPGQGHPSASAAPSASASTGGTSGN